MYGRMQDSGLTEMILLICISALWGQYLVFLGFSGDSVVKNPPAMQEIWVRSLDREDLLERKWQPTLVFLSGKPHGKRSLVGYSP